MPEIKEFAPQKPHNLILKDRKTLMITGVEDVESFDENEIVLFTSMGELIIKGDGLHISKLNLDTSELTVDGNVFAMTYTEIQKEKGGILTKIFR